MTMLRGLSAFPITPCDPGGRVDAAALRRLLAPLIEARVDSIGLLGSTGSYVYLTREERRRALEVAVEETAGRTPILVGIGALRTDETIRLAQDEGRGSRSRPARCRLLHAAERRRGVRALRRGRP